jgi:hypothetical protein
MTKQELKLRELMGSASLHFDLLCAVIRTCRTLEGTASAATKLDLIEKATAGILPRYAGVGRLRDLLRFQRPGGPKPVWLLTGHEYYVTWSSAFETNRRRH